MERVVYLLGAGFSAPLGLPVMSNFLEKSRDLFYLEDTLTPEQRSCFEEVFQAIHKMSVVKNYYKTDLFNIEEILSILEMQHSLEGKKLKEAFRRYISDVIQHYTPVVHPGQEISVDWSNRLFSADGKPSQLFGFFGFFVGSLLQLSISWPQRTANSYPDPAATYGVITLNYDMVLENFASSVREGFPRKPAPGFHRMVVASEEILDGRVLLAKLHGSIDNGEIVAPTWNKEVNQNLLPDWQIAFELLSKANHIRIIGYSLPTADAYIKYLLRAASIESSHLKRIDILCRDDRSNTVRARYEEFVDFARLRFLSGDVTDYLRAVYVASIESADPNRIELRHLESAHELFFA